MPIAHITQHPNTTSCGVVCLQMITGLSYEEVCSRIKFKYRGQLTDWADLRGVLRSVGQTVGNPRRFTKWSSIKQLAIVNVGNVKKDITHFMVYDGAAGTFYDPWRPAASSYSRRKPISYMPISPPIA